MRRRRPFGWLGPLMILIGILILLAMVLPAGFWWGLLGIALVFLGLRCCGR